MMPSLSAEVKSTAQLQARGHFTLFLGYEFCSLLKTILWLWNATIRTLFLYLNLCISVMLDSLSCIFTSVSFLTTINIVSRSCKYRLQMLEGQWQQSLNHLRETKIKCNTVETFIYTSQQKKRYNFFFKYIFMLKPKQLFIIIYVNVYVKHVSPHKTNNNILFRYEQISESQFSVPWSN